MSEDLPPPVLQKKPPLAGTLRGFALIVVPLLVIAGGWELFRLVKLQLALSRAHREFAGKQFMRAEFWTGRAFTVDERNLEATRLMAEINEAQDRPVALRWRTRIAQLNPGDAKDLMAWAKSALRFGQNDMAVSALTSLPADFVNRDAECHELMAGCALAARQNGLAEIHFEKAAELGRNNPLHQVNLDAFRLTNSSSRQIRTQASADLEGKLADPRVALLAARALLVDAIRNKDHPRAVRFVQQVQAAPNRELSDDLICLEAMMPEPAFHSTLDSVEHRTEASPPSAVETANWLTAHGLAGETMSWLGKAPPAVRANIPVQIALSEAFIALSDWKGLESFLSQCHWDDAEYLKRALIVRCKRETGQPWQDDWKQLVAGVEATPPEDLLLAHMIIGWGWRNETLDLLWAATRKPATEMPALNDLWRLYCDANDTAQLIRIAKAQIDLDPSNPTRKNNEAFLSLLLYGPSERASRLAKEASTANPKVPEWAATYAYAMHLEGRDSEAKKVMEALSSDALGRPGIGLYYAIVLAGNGDKDKAKETLRKLTPRGMLPEEQKLAIELAQQLGLTGKQ